LRQRSEQKRTDSQSLSHFLRQEKGRPQAAQGFVGNSDFLRIFGIWSFRCLFHEAGAVATIGNPARESLDLLRCLP
jgi:hypothetical protein